MDDSKFNLGGFGNGYTCLSKTIGGFDVTIHIEKITL